MSRQRGTLGEYYGGTYCNHLGQTQADPDHVRRSARVANARLFSRWFDNIKDGMHLVAVVLSESSRRKMRARVQRESSRSMTPSNDDLIKDIVRRIVETAQPDKIILFGSRARGDARPNSDFDVLVIKESGEPGYRRDAPLYLALAGLNAPVDLMVYTPEEVTDWSAVPQAFITTAVREGKVVYERKG